MKRGLREIAVDAREEAVGVQHGGGAELFDLADSKPASQRRSGEEAGGAGQEEEIT